MNSIYKSNVPFNVNKNTNKKATLERYAKFLDRWHGNKTPISAFLCGEKTTLTNVIRSSYHQMASSFERQKHHMRWKPWKTRFWFNPRHVKWDPFSNQIDTVWSGFSVCGSAWAAATYVRTFFLQSLGTFWSLWTIEWLKLTTCGVWWRGNFQEFSSCILPCLGCFITEFVKCIKMQ